MREHKRAFLVPPAADGEAPFIPEWFLLFERLCALASVPVIVIALVLK